MTPTISFSGTENEMIVTAAELPKRLLRFSTLSKGKFSDSTDAAIIQAHPLFKGDVGFLSSGRAGFSVVCSQRLSVNSGLDRLS